MSGLTLSSGIGNGSYDASSGITAAPQRLRDNVGKLKVSESQNLFEADFEYGLQPMRWENFVAGSGSVVQVSNSGGVLMSVSALVGDMAIRQTRPYQRYQPGKTMYMSSGFVFGPAVLNQRQRVGFFDDANGVFWEQGDPSSVNNGTGMGVVIRSDSGGLPTDTRIESGNWLDPYNIKSQINWSLIQMIWIEYAWYGAGLLRWGVMVNGEPYPLHQIGIGNRANQTGPWSRTGNLPVRYELRNIGASTASSMYHYGVSVLAEGKIDTQRGFTYPYALIGSKQPAASATRVPILSMRYRAMGTLEYGVDSAYSGSNGALPAGGSAIASVTQSATATTVNLTGTPLVAGAWAGKYLFARGATAAVTSVTASAGSAVLNTTANPNYMNLGRWITVSGATGNTTVNGTFQVTAVTNGTVTITGPLITAGAVTGTVVYTTGQGGIGRIIANTTSSLTVVDNVLSSTGVTYPMVVPPTVGGNYILGLIDRGQILPQTLSVFATQNCTLELITSTVTSPVSLTGASWTTLYSTGSLNSFGEKDTSSTALTGGEVVYATPMPSSGGLQSFDLSQFFPLYNNISGNQPDILSLVVTTPTGFTGSVAASIVGQEAMS
jgi:hypothetical protein